MDVPAPQGITVRDAATKFTAALTPKPATPVEPQESENIETLSPVEATVTDEPTVETPPAQERPTLRFEVDGVEVVLDEDEARRRQQPKSAKRRRLKWRQRVQSGSTTIQR